MADAVTKPKPSPKPLLDRVDVDPVAHLGGEVAATHLLYIWVGVRVRVGLGVGRRGRGYAPD